MNTRISLLSQARALMQDGLFDEATLLFEQIRPSNTDNWWLQLEYARARRHGRLWRTGGNSFRLFFSPFYQANHYQALLHASLLDEGISAEAIEGEALADVAELVLRDDFPFVFHQHWLKEIYRGLRADVAGFDTVGRYFSTLRLLRSIGGKVLWTVHNLIDHDLEPSERHLNIYCLQEMAKVSDCILLHDIEVASLLEQVCGCELRSKCHVLHHPLYDMPDSEKSECPPEMRGMQPKAGTTFLSFGLLRPYKGGKELLTQYLAGVRSNKLPETRLIIAGVIQDKSLLREYETQKQLAQDNVVLINRRVSDAELAWLCQHADAAVMPYRDILTSGSFYQATTHALPTIAPTSGMFVTTVQDGENGLLYASDTALGDALIRANKLGKQHLKVLGQAALTRSLAQSASALFSARYQALLHQILKTGKVDAAF